jgi:tetratricopeptide (TPR) repeat protein
VGSQLPQVLAAVGMLYLTTGKDEGAEALFGRALQIDPQFALAMRGLASVHERRLEFDAAESRFKQAARLQPGNWRTRNELGSLYFAAGRYADAAEEYRGILEVHPDNYAALGNLASMELMLGHFEAAREAMERSLDIDYNATYASNLGIIHYYLGDFDRSVEIHREVVEATPRSSASWVNLGDALHFTGDEAAAREAFGNAMRFARADLDVRPDDPEALTYLAWSLTMVGNGEEGLRQAERAVTIDPNDPYSHYYVGLIHTRLHQYDEAVDALERAVANGYAKTLLVAEPYLEPLNDNRRFARLLR